MSFCQPTGVHDGDRVLFYGDSITAQRFYTRFVEDFLLTRYPGMHVSFVNAGVPGDTVYGGYTGDQTTRLERDVFPHRPTVITVMLGMNDGYYVPFEQKYFDIYKSGYGALITSIQSSLPGVRITLMTPTPYDEITHGTEFSHYNEVMSHYAGFLREFAASSHLPWSDSYEAIAAVANAGANQNSSLAALLIPDRIHPAEPTHWVIAAELARTWGLSPIVSRVTLDASKVSILEENNARVSDLVAENNTLRWTQSDQALPLPLPLENEMMQFVLSVSKLAEEDQQILRVDGLSAPRYLLTIDRHAIASFSRKELATGINLALFPTPMENQAKDVDGIERKRTQLDEANFILTIDDPKFAADPAAIKELETKDSALIEEERKACRPRPHAFVLLPQ